MNRTHSFILSGVVLLVGFIFLVRLFFIQVVEPEYKAQAERNIIRRIAEYPTRGVIYDRKGNLLVYNNREFELLAVHEEMKNFDSLAFRELFGISRDSLRKLFKDMTARAGYAKHKPCPFLRKLSMQDLAQVQDKLDNFPGLIVQPRSARAYMRTSAGNVFGYVSEVSRDQLARDSSHFYKQGDYIGQTGIEASYERFLRGVRGVRYEMQDVKGVSKGKYKNGEMDTMAVAGKDIISTLDIELQEYGELLMKKKVGSVVCIEPASGEILAFVSSPSYNPNSLEGRNFGENFQKLSLDSLKPLFMRPLMAQYRPGSIFKVVQALTALQENAITPQTRIRCDRTLINCHGSHTMEDLQGAITSSCNPYFYNVFRRIVLQEDNKDVFANSRAGLSKWDKMVGSMGFGSRLGVDLPNEKKGLIPTPEYYDAAYGNRPWKFSNIYSLAIGEGENLVVPIQMANLAAIIANRGFYYIPHIVKDIDKKGALPPFLKKMETLIEQQHFDVVVNAMSEVVKHGTGIRANLRNIEVCGKTGTVQNKPPRLDHSVFIAFAPRENPAIAVSVYVENAGQGARAAASIASLMIEKYLLGKTERPYIEEYVSKGKFF